MLMKWLWVSSEGSRLSAAVEASSGDMGVGVELNAGLVVKAGDKSLLMGDPSCVMYPGSESVPSGVMWLYVPNSGKLNLIPLSESGSCGGRLGMGYAETVGNCMAMLGNVVRADVGSDKAQRSSNQRLS